MKVNVKVNGQNKVFNIEPGDYLLDTLRKENYLSVKKGCDNSSCGVCTVLFDGKPIKSCSLLTAKTEGHEVTTVEGIQKEADKLSDYFGAEGADQCGYCTPGMALSVHALKEENSNPSDEEIKEYLTGNLCRCTGYQSQHIAIRNYLEDK
ncbi:MAG: Nicotinate dehydrogenase small FeS subunit [Candidatus Izimaplasma bacterium HR2]|nr:MAG: Nicotinate dehydrogenase small FeS subunit [Candidatus Izimaplasma bacterium HR2]